VLAGGGALVGLFQFASFGVLAEALINLYRRLIFTAVLRQEIPSSDRDAKIMMQSLFLFPGLAGANAVVASSPVRHLWHHGRAAIHRVQRLPFAVVLCQQIFVTFL
jgi:hypothetical protein